MKEIFDFLKFIGEKFGLTAMIIIGVLIGFIFISVLLLRNPRIVRKILEYFDERANRISKRILRKHQILKKKYDFLYKIKLIRFPGEYYKTEIIKLIFRTRILINHNLLKAFLNTDKLKNTPKLKLLHFMYVLLEDISSEFNMIFKNKLREFVQLHINLYRKNYTDNEINIFTDQLYELIITAWNVKQDERLKIIQQYVSEIPENIIYNNNFERVHRLFDILYVSLDTEINDAVKIYSKMNGRIQEMFDNFIKGYILT